jgi:hypothetical protein
MTQLDLRIAIFLNPFLYVNHCFLHFMKSEINAIAVRYWRIRESALSITAMHNFLFFNGHQYHYC